jgi:hypothetical protein
MRRRFFQSAGLYLLDKVIYVHPYCRTRVGVRVAMPDIAAIVSGDAAEIGSQLLAMLDKCIDNVPDETVGGKHPTMSAMAAMAGLRSWKSFQVKSLYVSAFRELKSGVVELTPALNSGRGWNDIDDKKCLSGIDPSELGKNIAIAFSHAR